MLLVCAQDVRTGNVCVLDVCERDVRLRHVSVRDAYVRDIHVRNLNMPGFSEDDAVCEYVCLRDVDILYTDISNTDI